SVVGCSAKCLRRSILTVFMSPYLLDQISSRETSPQRGSLRFPLDAIGSWRRRALVRRLRRRRGFRLLRRLADHPGDQRAEAFEPYEPLLLARPHALDRAGELVGIGRRDAHDERQAGSFHEADDRKRCVRKMSEAA